ncbi:MAG: hypothetical protein C5B59_06755 [Bacteroidetes bacterium]|nr:MAG: hypothetical protein C5B59_06755 [Bacteroidota bacterium]
MSDFDFAWPTLLRHEGGYVNNPADPGGATKYGISLRWLKSQGLYGDVNHDLVIDIKDIQALTPDLAAGFYRVSWWDKYGIGRVIDQSIATKLIDTAVNLGTPRAVKIVQNALGTAVDGVLGPKTVKAANDAQASVLLSRMRSLQAALYQSLVNSNPSLQQFLPGWLNRAWDRV